MNLLTNDDFINFLNSFKSEYCKPISEISKSKTKKADSVVEFDMNMLSFDDICQNSPKLNKQLPTSVDAIDYHVDGDDNLTFYIIEFKYHDLNEDKVYKNLVQVHNALKNKNKKYYEFSDRKIISDSILKKFETVREHFMDSVEVNLILKPLETINIDLPILYEEYCNNHPEVIKKDLKGYLNSIPIKLVVFVRTYDKNYQHDNYEAQRMADRLESYYKRFKNANIIESYSIKPGYKFKNFLKNEHLIKN